MSSVELTANHILTSDWAAGAYSDAYLLAGVTLPSFANFSVMQFDLSSLRGSLKSLTQVLLKIRANDTGVFGVVDETAVDRLFTQNDDASSKSASELLTAVQAADHSYYNAVISETIDPYGLYELALSIDKADIDTGGNLILGLYPVIDALVTNHSLAFFGNHATYAPVLEIEYTELDPLSIVYYGLWELLEASSDFTDLVRVGNRIKFAGSNRDPIKRQVSEADMPEVRIIATDATPTIHPCSGKTRITKRFQIQVSTGDQRFTEHCFPVQWAIFRAMKNWEAYLQSLRWNGKKFVIVGRPLTSYETVSELDLKRGLEGWMTIWTTEVDMMFDLADM